MDAAVLVAALAVTTDNLRVSVPLGLALASRAARLRLALGFAIAETVAPLLGATAGAAGAQLLGTVAQLGAWLLVALGVYLAVEPDRRGTEAASGPVPLRGIALWLPLVLSLDNAAAGVGLGLLGYPALQLGLAIGGLSGALSLLGLEFGARLAGMNLDTAHRLGGISLAAVGVVLIVVG